MITRRLVVALALAAGAAASAAPQKLPTHQTALFTCGKNEQLAAPLPVDWQHIMIAADGRLFSPCPPYPVVPEVGQIAQGPNDRNARESILVRSATTSRDPLIRQASAQAMGRIALPWLVMTVSYPESGGGTAPPGPRAPRAGPLLQLLNDPVKPVRLEAANAIGDALSGVRGDWGELIKATPDQIAFVHDALLARLAREQDDEVCGTILETLGRLPYADDAARDEVEKQIASYGTSGPARTLGIAKGLEVLIRKSPRRAVGPDARTRLRTIVADGTSQPRPRRVAMNALQSARDDDMPTVLHAASDADWQVRRLAALRMDLARPEMAAIIEKLGADPEFQVRYEIVTLIGRQAARTKSCAPLIYYIRDPEPTVALHALDVVPDGCMDKDALLPSVVLPVRSLARTDATGDWHVPAHALAALAHLNPLAAKNSLADASAHPVWQVRAMAATTAGVLGEVDAAVLLANDKMPNVRTAALDTLVRLKSSAVFDVAIAALSSDDYQLLRTAAGALKGVPESLHEVARAGLVQALQRLTDSGRDTSRDPRLAIIERLKEVLKPDSVSVLEPYVADFDPQVRTAAAGAIASVLGQPAPVYRNPQQRYPWQPAGAMLTQLPAHATIQMADEKTIELELLVKQAPVTVARFVELAKAGYYDGLTFHRVVPNFVIQGGSPGASEYMGADRYWRDELGLESNLRGSVGLSTRGRDSGDGQFYINLVDLPRLDHDYTIFARVTGGLDVVDRILEGAKILRVTIR